MRDFEKIYAEYFSYINHYLLALCRNPSEAEEMAEETFFKALKNIEKFEGRCDIKTWLCQIARNTYFSRAKKNRAGEIHTEFSNENSVENTFADKETAFSIHKFLHDMEEPYKEVFTLRVFGELPYPQIAELFGKTESWARVTFHRAKGKITEFLKEENHE